MCWTIFIQTQKVLINIGGLSIELAHFVCYNSSKIKYIHTILEKNLILTSYFQFILVVALSLNVPVERRKSCKKKVKATCHRLQPNYLFCSVYAHMEDLSEDSFYFFYKANLIEKVDFQKKLNSAHDFNSTEER